MPNTSILSAFNSNDWSLPWLFTIFPIIDTEVPVLILLIKSISIFVKSITTSRFFIVEPSLIDRKATFLLCLLFLTQPEINISLDSFEASTISITLYLIPALYRFIESKWLFWWRYG